MCRSSVAFAQRFNWTDMPQVQQDWPPEWWQVTQAQRSEMMTASIRVPHTRGQWPPVRPRSLQPLLWNWGCMVLALKRVMLKSSRKALRCGSASICTATNCTDLSWSWDPHMSARHTSRRDRQKAPLASIPGAEFRNKAHFQALASVSEFDCVESAISDEYQHI